MLLSLVLLLESKYFARFAIAYTSSLLLQVFRFAMADFTAKKAKVMDRRARIRHSIQLEVEAESEGRLQRVKSQLHNVRSVLHITAGLRWVIC